MTERSTRKTGFFLEFFIFQTEPFRWKTAFIIQGIFFFLRLDTVTTAVGWKNNESDICFGKTFLAWNEFRKDQNTGISFRILCFENFFDPLVSTFISQRTNNRTDEFGGCFENRMRLPRLIIENIRKKTGGNLPILCRINACDEVPGGQSVQDAAAVAAYLEQECGVDALHVTRAGHLHDEFMWAPGITHGGFNAGLVTEIKRGVSVPVIIVGRFTEPQYAELLVKRGRCDLVAFGRQSIADPELPNKARNNQLETLAPCIGCLLGCVPNMFAGRPITCAVNPCVGRETEIVPAETSQNVVVVGGGPGGLYAAYILALRGHKVTLLEKNAELGGNFPPARDS